MISLKHITSKEITLLVFQERKRKEKVILTLQSLEKIDLSGKLLNPF